MKLDYDKIVEGFDVSNLNKKKITASFVRKNFKSEISDLIELSKQPTSEEKISNETAIPLQSLFMGQEIKKSVWIGYVDNLIKGEYMKVVSNQQGHFIVSFDKQTANPANDVIEALEGIKEKDIVAGIKKSLLKLL